MKVRVSKLSPHPLNRKIYQISSIEELMSSIEEVGLLENLVINQQNQVISGNRRLEALKRLNWKTVDCDRIHLKKKDVPKYLIHYNKQRIKTCRELLNEVKILLPMLQVGQGKRTDLTSVRANKGFSARDVLAEEIGISSSQIAKLLFIDKEDASFIDFIDEGITTINQAYLLVRRMKKEKEGRRNNSNGKKLINGDGFTFYNKSSCSMDEIGNDEADLIFTSPPYWNKRKYSESDGLGNERKPQKYVDDLSSHLDDCKRILHPKGSFFLVLGDTFHDGNLLNLPHKVVLHLQERGWLLRNTIIWSKTNPKPQSSKNNLTPTYEFIFHLVRGLDYKYQHTLSPLKNTTKPSHPPRHRDINIRRKKEYPYIPRSGKNMGDFWSGEIVRVAVVNQASIKSNVEHPAPFPEDIVTLPILQTTIEGDLVVDPFMGTGTTGKIANRYGRRFVGYDIRTY